MRVWTRLKPNLPPISAACEWRSRVPLINNKRWSNTKNCSQNLIANPGFATPTHTTLLVSGMDSTGKRLSSFNTGIDLPITPPSITGVFDANGMNTSSATAGETLTIKGELFSYLVFSAYLEYPAYDNQRQLKSIKRLRLKVDRKSFIYKNMRGARSPMDPPTGLSQISVIMPKSWPRNWDHSVLHNLVIGNGTGRTTIKFQTSE